VTSAKAGLVVMSETRACHVVSALRKGK
jgi:hypothetical protein